MFHTARVFEEMVWFHPGFLHHSRLQRSPTKQAPGLWTCCRLSRRRHVTKATHTHARTLATSTSSANRAAAAALRCSLTGFNVFSFFFLLLVEKEKSDTGTGHPRVTGQQHPQPHSAEAGGGRLQLRPHSPCIGERCNHDCIGASQGTAFPRPLTDRRRCSLRDRSREQM